MNNRRKQLMLASAKEYCKCVVEGKTLKYNQLANIQDSAQQTINGLQVYAKNGVITINGTGDSGTTSFDYQINNYSYNGFISGHKYFVWCKQKTWGKVYLVVGSPYDELSTIEKIFVCTNSQYLILRIACSGQTYDNYKAIPYVIDLTALGLDNVNSVADFYATDLGKYVKNGNYLPFSSGDFIHSKTPIHFKGVNIWNEQWEVGYLNLSNGQDAVGNNDEIRSVDYIKVLPNKKYYYNNAGRFCYYDANKNYLGNSGYLINSYFETPSDCHYIRFYTSDYGIVYNHNICIGENIWNENWEVGHYLANAINNVGKISVLPSKTFYVYCPTDITIYEFDSNNVNTRTNNLSGADKTFKTRDDTRTIAFYVSTSYGTTYNNNIGIFYLGYHKCCNVDAFVSGFNLIKGDIFKTYGLDEITYNQLVDNGNFIDTDNWSGTNGTITQSHDNTLIYTITTIGSDNTSNSVDQVFEHTTSHKYIVFVNILCPHETDILINSGTYQTIGRTSANSVTNLAYIYSATNVGDGNLYFDIHGQASYSVGNQIKVYKFMKIDLTELGLDDITSVEDFNETPLGKLIQKGYYLEYTEDNLTTKEQLVRTMGIVDLGSLTWSYDSYNLAFYANLANLKDVPYGASQPAPNLYCPLFIARNTYYLRTSEDKIMSTNNGATLDNRRLFIKDTSFNGDANAFKSAMSGVQCLYEYVTPEIIDYYRVRVGVHLIKYYVVDNMVSRRTINVESNNGIDMDFTKE